jgi:SagB-type dehydrogenase family enzyme
MVADDPVRHRQLALTTSAQRLLHRFADWMDVPDAAASADELDSQLVRQLLSAHILVAEGSPEHRLEEELGPWAEWGTAATYYHLASRNLHNEKFASAAEDTAWLLDHLPDRPQPPEAKEYPGVRRILLPHGDDTLLAEARLDHVLRARRTTRQLQKGQPVTDGQLATMLRWVAGPLHHVRAPKLRPAMLKASPSSGGLHTLEVYPVVLNISGIAPGVYHYHSTDHALEPVIPGPVDVEQLVHWCGDQTYVRHAGALLLYTAVLDRTAWKYRTGGVYRSFFIELGHFSQTAYLVGTALGLGMFFTAASRDAAIEDALGIDWTQEILLGINGMGVTAPGEAARQEAMLAGGEADFSFAGDAWDGRGS